MIKKATLLFSLLVPLACGVKGYGQSLQVKLHDLLYSTVTLKEWSVSDTSLLQTFYKSQNERLFWMEQHNAVAKNEVLQLIEKADAFGLNKADYHHAAIAMWQATPGKLRTAVDSIQADFILSDALLHLITDIRYGRTPSFQYNGLRSAPDQREQIVLLQKLLTAPDKVAFLESLEPDTQSYKCMKAIYAKLVKMQGYGEFPIVSNIVALTNKPLVFKLAQLGLLDTTALTIKHLVESVKQAQRLLDLAPDGKLGHQTLKALNVSLVQRVAALESALNDLRWLRRYQGDSIAVVNIPSASLFVFDGGRLIYESRLVVGKKRTPTPTLSSKINEVILYPYWTVPYSIATKELLPNIKKNIGYLAANNFQVLNKQGKVVDPTTIDWKALSTVNFPYTIRQSTGCDNSLGIVKFNFNNPFSVYLHDTPSKGLFALKKRYFSHGCMRVEKPVELAELLLQEERATVKRLTEQCLRDQKPIAFALKSPIPVVVLYNTVWYDTKGNTIFYDDVYGK